MTETLNDLRGMRGRWQLRDPLPTEIRDRVERDGHSVMLSHLLYHRGCRTVEAIETFFAGELPEHDPFLLPDMTAAVTRILTAVGQGERIAVYGDFDCDGITATVVLDDLLRSLGADVVTVIPERSDGHGLHPEVLAELADRGVDLIVTGDCGITALAEVEVARGMGMDVVVTDHHEPRIDLSLPNCLTISPTRLDAAYPFRSLCGVGVAYKLAQAIAARDTRASNPASYLDLVALGTVADVVPLRDENRSLVIRGLGALRRTTRPGLKALFAAAGVTADRVDPIAIGFYLAPRINAANRLATPQLAFELLTTDDPVRAHALASDLNRYNERRQMLVERCLAEVVATLGTPEEVADRVRSGAEAPILTVIGDWPRGISGLLAGQLAERYGLPAFTGGRTEGVVAVSGRSVPGVRLDEILEGCEASLPGGIFLGYGGHSGAGGFQVTDDKLETALALLREQAGRQVSVDAIGAGLTIDAEVSLRQLTLTSAQRVAGLAPFGVDFPEPVFLARNVALRRPRLLKDGRHLQFALRSGPHEIDGVAFRADPALRSLTEGTIIDAAITLTVDEWKGNRKAKVQLKDWRPVAS